MRDLLFVEELRHPPCDAEDSVRGLGSSFPRGTHGSPALDSDTVPAGLGAVPEIDPGPPVFRNTPLIHRLFASPWGPEIALATPSTRARRYRVKPKVTHLTLPDRERQLAAIRAAQQGLTLSDYAAKVIREDAERAGLLQYLGGKEEVARGKK